MFLFSSKKQKGFTLVEMLIAIAIIGIISSVLVFGYNDGADRQIVLNAVGEIETTLRQAQVFATSARPYPPGAGPSDVDRFDRGYGVYFGEDSDIYVLYGGQDTANNLYNGSNFVTKFELPNRVKVESICFGEDKDSALECTEREPGVENEELHVHFRRPGLSAVISDGDENLWSVASVLLQSSRNDTQNRNILIFESGRFSVVNQTP